MKKVYTVVQSGEIEKSKEVSDYYKIGSNCSTLEEAKELFDQVKNDNCNMPNNHYQITNIEELYVAENDDEKDDADDLNLKNIFNIVESYKYEK